MFLCVFRPCCPPGVGLTQCWTTPTWWSAATCPASPRERRTDISSARYNTHRCQMYPCMCGNDCSNSCCCLILVVAGHAEVLHRLRDQWPDRKRSDAERDDYTSLWQDHLSTGTDVKQVLKGKDRHAISLSFSNFQLYILIESTISLSLSF